MEQVWYPLATAAFDVVDRAAPSVAFLAPEPHSVHAGPLLVLAEANDALDAVVRVELGVAEAAWAAMQWESGEGPSRWSSLATPARDGSVLLRLRAFDGAGNPSLVQERTVVFDATPPIINVAGVADGALRNQPVILDVSVQDLTQVTTIVLLNGSSHTPGSVIATDG